MIDSLSFFLILSRAGQGRDLSIYKRDHLMKKAIFFHGRPDLPSYKNKQLSTSPDRFRLQQLLTNGILSWTCIFKYHSKCLGASITNWIVYRACPATGISCCLLWSWSVYSNWTRCTLKWWSRTLDWIDWSVRPRLTCPIVLCWTNVRYCRSWLLYNFFFFCWTFFFEFQLVRIGFKVIVRFQSIRPAG